MINPHTKRVQDMANYCVNHMCKHEKCKYYIYCKAFREKYKETPSYSAVGGYWRVGDYAYDKNERLIELFSVEDK